MAKKKISGRVMVCAQLTIKIARTGKLTNSEYVTIGKFQESLPPLITEVEKKTAQTFLELLGEFHERERLAKKAAKQKGGGVGNISQKLKDKVKGGKK